MIIRVAVKVESFHLKKEEILVANKLWVNRIVVAMIMLFILATTVGAATQDWDDIIAKAKNEGAVVTYGTSSRLPRVGEVMKEKYGIEVKHVKLSLHEITERIKREQDAGVYTVDFIMAEDMIGTTRLLLPNGYVENFVPSTCEDLISPEYKDPFVFLLQSRPILYNTESYDEFPIKNLWELTTEKWRGKFILRDPEITPTTISFFAEIIDKADLMAAAYKEFFGKEIKLTTPNAGWEFIKKLAKNKVVTTTGDTEVAEAVGARGQKEAPLGLCVAGKLRMNETDGLALGVIEGINPTNGYYYPAYGLIVNKAPHPNAAKLLVHTLMTDEGAQAWTQDEGCFSTNPKLSYNQLDPIGGLKEWEEAAWSLDVDNTIKYSRDILDFWIVERQ